MGTTPVAAGIARAVATIGLSTVHAQDAFGLITFEDGWERLAGLRPRVGRAHVIHCLEAYQGRARMEPVRRARNLPATLSGQLRRPTLLPVVSDFLCHEPRVVVRDLAALQAVHDVFLVIVDSAFAMRLPDVSAGWVTVFDVETGRSRVLSRRQVGELAERVREWQDLVEALARDAGLDVLRLGVDPRESLPALIEFVTVRKLRKR
jgi:hypothetical protein